ncbi:helix-turn-helix domain-containing protein [Microbulbifer sp. 2304DJ12-6]|uniref:helix-turn-helix domain-containing protein n=1 Tax=Microbulbifer sp. 2304DJ12-6 TaxID=3233340 RepID=UPI0039AF87B7
MSIGKRIRSARQANGWSQAELAHHCGWEHQSRISGYENDKREPSFEDVRVIASALGIPAVSLYSDGANSIQEQDGNYHANVAPGPDIRGKIPLISWVQAGDWAEIVDNFTPGEADEWRETTARVGPHAFALRVEGDSMTAPSGLSIPEGSVVIVDPDAAYMNGSIVVAKLVDTQEATLKKLVIDGPNKYLKPLNPAYAPIPINSNSRIVGVAKKFEFDL